jgi:hypothetical protein
MGDLLVENSISRQLSELRAEAAHALSGYGRD